LDRRDGNRYDDDDEYVDDDGDSNGDRNVDSDVHHYYDHQCKTSSSLSSRP